MLFSTAVVENEKEMQKAELHLGYLLGEAKSRERQMTNVEPLKEAETYFAQLKGREPR